MHRVGRRQRGGAPLDDRLIAPGGADIAGGASSHRAASLAERDSRALGLGVLASPPRDCSPMVSAYARARPSASASPRPDDDDPYGLHHPRARAVTYDQYMQQRPGDADPYGGGDMGCLAEIFMCFDMTGGAAGDPHHPSAPVAAYGGASWGGHGAPQSASAVPATPPKQPPTQLDESRLLRSV